MLVAVKERGSVDMMQPLTIDPELARQLKEAAAAGRSVAVVIDDRTYRLSITAESEVDLWEDYDPEGVLEAVRRSAAMSSTADTAELDALVAEIRAQRDQAPDDFHS
jgi:hypothetical protein